MKRMSVVEFDEIVGVGQHQYITLVCVFAVPFIIFEVSTLAYLDSLTFTNIQPLRCCLCFTAVPWNIPFIHDCFLAHIG